MSRRTNPDRCATCRMHATLCICSLVPQLATRTRLALVVHHREARKPTNTGQLAARCLARSAIAIVGERDQPGGPTGDGAVELPSVDGDAQAVVLFPGDDAVPIARYAEAGRPIVLVVPDGTWRQASKLRRRVPGLAALPCVSIPETGATEYRLRAEHRVGGLATFEAIARALRILEADAGPAIEAAMTAVFRVMVDRTLWLRGALRDDQVTGGIPPAALAADPRGGRADRDLRAGSESRQRVVLDP
jgi:DTW domain-containing protein YfiP